MKRQKQSEKPWWCLCGINQSAYCIPKSILAAIQKKVFPNKCACLLISSIHYQYNRNNFFLLKRIVFETIFSYGFSSGISWKRSFIDFRWNFSLFTYQNIFFTWYLKKSNNEGKCREIILFIDANHGIVRHQFSMTSNSLNFNRFSNLLATTKFRMNQKFIFMYNIVLILSLLMMIMVMLMQIILNI